VEYFFHKSCVLIEDRLIDVNMKNVRSSREEKVKKAHGILKIIEPCAHVLEVNFPLWRSTSLFLETMVHMRLLLDTELSTLITELPARVVSVILWMCAWMKSRLCPP